MSFITKDDILVAACDFCGDVLVPEEVNEMQPEGTTDMLHSSTEMGGAAPSMALTKHICVPCTRGLKELLKGDKSKGKILKLERVQ